MTENEARQVLLLQAREEGPETALWTAEDRAWATRQAIATLGEQAAPERFVATRAALALQRLLPRDRAGERWLSRRAWHPAWVVLALVLGGFAGLAVDQLGPPQRVNLLAPAVWIVVAWNLAVYAALLLPLPTLGLRRWLASWGRPGGGELSRLALLWVRHAAPLSTARAALVLHAAASALALGLVAGLYLRGLVLDYRVGWQSTFLETAAVQTLLAALLAPASAVTGIAVADVAPLRVGPDAAATASAAPWIHLFGATLALFVVLPRLLLALVAAASAARQARRFPLPLDGRYFEALHPLMRPGLPRALRLLWVGTAPATLFGHHVAALDAPLTLLRSDEGDELQLDPVPPSLDSPAPAGSRWQRWLGAGDPAAARLARLRDEIDVVLLVTTAEAPRPPWLAALAKPVIVLVDAGDAPAPPQLALQHLADGWLPDGRLLQALAGTLDSDPRLPRLAASWARQQQTRFDTAMAELAVCLARIASARAPVADDGFLARRAEADAARAALAAALESELQASGERLAALLGQAAGAVAPTNTLPAALHARVGEGRVALVGGVVTGALAGLKADLLSGGLTLGAGMVAGGLLGALGGAGVARGLNVVRGTDRSYAAWNEEALAPITEAVLLRYLAQAHGLPQALAAERLTAALAPRRRELAALWKARSTKFDNAGAADTLAVALQPLLAQVVKTALAAQVHHPRS